MLSPADEAELIAWILREATARSDIQGLVVGVCERLRAFGVPLRRLTVTVPVIDPLVRGASLIWEHGKPLVFYSTSHDDGDTIFRRSPIFTLIEKGLFFGRWRLDQGEDFARYPLLVDLQAEGYTDYVLFVVPFADDSALIGTGISISTDRSGGFDEEHVRLVERLLPASALAIFRLSLWRTAIEAFNVYLGPMTGRRIFAGHVRRGQGETISAAILLFDLTGFSTLADRHDATLVVGWLNQHLEAVGEAVMAEGGEILKFTGDGLLAVFAVGDQTALPCPQCTKALAAAERACAANDAVNAARRDAGAPELQADIVLHFGDVIYGNVGTRRRLDFTTIGRAINEASRIETLCGEIGRRLVLSDTFAARCDRTFVPLGSFVLRGLAAPRTLYGID